MTNEEKRKIYVALAAPFPEQAIQRTEGRVTGRGYDTAFKERSDIVLKKLDDQLGRARYVHTLQFQKEFQLYEKAWAALLAVRNKTLALRPVADTHDPSESEEERKKRRLAEFIDAYNIFGSSSRQMSRSSQNLYSRRSMRSQEPCGKRRLTTDTIRRLGGTHSTGSVRRRTQTK